MDVPSHPQEENKNDHLISGQPDVFGLNSDPVITYDHMSEETGFRKRYFYQKSQNYDVRLWTVFFEEMIIALLLLLLILTN